MRSRERLQNPSYSGSALNTGDFPACSDCKNKCWYVINVTLKSPRLNVGSGDVQNFTRSFSCLSVAITRAGSGPSLTSLMKWAVTSFDLHYITYVFAPYHFPDGHNNKAEPHGNAKSDQAFHPTWPSVIVQLTSQSKTTDSSNDELFVVMSQIFAICNKLGGCYHINPLGTMVIYIYTRMPTAHHNAHI